MTKTKSRVFLTGDLHGQIDISKLNTANFPQQRELTKDDYLIILGDFGLIWDVNESKKEEAHWVDWLSTRNYTTIVVLGNHENYDRIEELPEVDMFDGKVLKYTDSIYCLKRGEIYNILGKSWFTMGGAESIDKNTRTDKLNWWSQEIPSYEEFNNGLDELDRELYEVDYVLTHTAPKRVITQYMNSCRDSYIDEFKGQYADGELPVDFYDRITDEFIDTEFFDAKKDTVSDYLDDVFFGEPTLTFKFHFFGHMHDNWVSKNGKHVMLYKKIIELDVDNGSYQ